MKPAGVLSFHHRHGRDVTIDSPDSPRRAMGPVGARSVAVQRGIVISLAPAELKKEGAVFDVPAALSYLLASQQVKFDARGKIFTGELGLDGTLRPIRGARKLLDQ